MKNKMKNHKPLICLNKKGVSMMIGYVLLITSAIVISVIVYQWIKTYVPREQLQCPEGSSVFLKDYSYNGNSLSITFQNNGRFNVAGYFIHGTDDPDQEVAAIDLSEYCGESKIGDAILFGGETNSFGPNEEETHIFDLSSIGEIYSISILPVRFQEEENKERFVSCSAADIYLKLIQDEECTPETCSSLNYECGNWPDTCGDILDCDVEVGCVGEEVCDVNGQCVPLGECTDTCAGLGYTCGNICGENCLPGCEGVEECVAGECVSDCGNEELDLGEECDDGGTSNGDGCSSICVIESGWECDSAEPSNCYKCDSDGTCELAEGETCLCDDCNYQQTNCNENYLCIDKQCIAIEGTFNSCGDYCDLFGFSASFSCQDNPQKCAPPQGPDGGIYIGEIPGADEETGNSFCSGDPYCCCSVSLECSSGQDIGDIDGDGDIDSFDVDLASYIYTDLLSEPTNICCGDANEDSYIDILDSFTIAQIVAGERESPGVC